ncbi:MAG: DUF4465 domain-containing protein [Prevotellaceae bacterium]|jgi:hypothetical protein|nr:DUF4465 domain-containing protein [Prevotellaceae bacterium]
MKKTNKFFDRCKTTFMVLPAVAMLTFTGCTKDDNIDDNPAPYVITFENVDPSYLAGPTAYGANLYSGHENQYLGYSDTGSGLYMMINETGDYSDVPTFYNGGVAISQWNDTTTAGYTNQCSVYYRDVTTGKGGYDGSNTFAVSYGNSSVSFLNGKKGTDKECVFDHFYVTNTTYAALSMKNGDAFGAKVFNRDDKDWFKLVIEGVNKSGVSTGTVEFYLADFRTASSPGVITEWTKVDLSPLGSVAEIKFNLQSNDVGEYGMKTPAYFCFDNLAIKQ